MSEKPISYTKFIEEWKGPEKGDVPRFRMYDKIAEAVQSRFAEKGAPLEDEDVSKISEVEALSGETPYEKISGVSNLYDVSILERALRLSRAVARIMLPTGGLATGFMISHNVLLTNRHVFSSGDDTNGARVQFNYQRDLLGNVGPIEEYPLTSESFIKADAALDFAVVKFDYASPGTRWGDIPLISGEINKDKDVYIIQHPGGQPKQIAMADNEVSYVGTNVMHYITDTMPGSSGSPVFNERFELVALHHAGGWLPQPGGGGVYFRNEGIRITAILPKLPPL